MRESGAFNETKFPPKPEYAEEYHETVAAGLERCKELSVIVWARPMVDAIEPDVLGARLDQLASLFADCAVVEHLPAGEYDSKFSHAIILDPTPGGWSYEGIANTFGQRTGWDVVASNGIYGQSYLQFDSFSYRVYGRWSRPSTHEFYMLRLKRGCPLMPVNSAFGGLAVYRIETLRYAHLTDDYVAFHRCLHQNGYGRIYLNPSQIVLL